MPTKSTPKSTGQKGQAKATQANISSGIPENKNVAEKPYDIPAPPSHSPEYTPSQPIQSNGDKEGPINRKKQKRREKEAAKKAAEQLNTGTREPRNTSDINDHEYFGSEYEDAGRYEPEDGEDNYYTDEATHYHTLTDHNFHRTGFNGHNSYKEGLSEIGTAKGKKKKKKRGNSSGMENTQLHDGLPTRDRIWNTSTAEERERIKEFWLSLGEEDRRSLVKVEKEAVLKKMKEQQKHSCSCTVCGRKRTAIEEELEVLYDAYYEELEQYANHQQVNTEDGALGLAAPRPYPPHFSHRPFSRHNSHTYDAKSSSARIQDLDDEDEAGDADVGTDVADDGMSEKYTDPEPEAVPSSVDFFNFGNSLTVQGGILTVADDLLQNDGKKFIEMMEQLAERRMQREEDAQYAASGMSSQHNHNDPLEDELYDDIDEEEDYESQEDDEFEEDDMEMMTEEQRMEEGRRMFQIFAARMFEQRVLTAYREKVALERQQKLIEELDDESRIDAQREAKKAKEAQKKKDKKRQQKLAKDEEKARKEAEKAAEEAEAKAQEQKKSEEQRLKKEEQRKKREAEKKLQDEEKARKEAEKQRKLQEARDLQAEQERKQREQKERERKKRDEFRKREQEEREAKEKEAKEAEMKLKEAKERKEQELKSQAMKAKGHPSKEELPTTRPAAQPLPKRPSFVSASATSAGPTSLQPPITTSSHTSPHLAIATPVIPKASTPARPRQPSFQDSRATSPKQALPKILPAASPNVTAIPPGESQNHFPSPKQTTPPQSMFSQYRASPQDASPVLSTRAPGMPHKLATSGPAFNSSFGPTISEVIAPFKSATSSHSGNSSAVAGHYDLYPIANQLPHGLGTFEPPQVPKTRGNMDPPPLPPPGIGRPQAATFGEIGQPSRHRESVASQTHSRNTSTSSNVAASNQPIGRPTPIQRPSSMAPHQQFSGRGVRESRDVDDLANHLGSKALLDDDDVELPLSSPAPVDFSGMSMAVGAPPRPRNPYGPPPGIPNPLHRAARRHAWPIPSAQPAFPSQSHFIRPSGVDTIKPVSFSDMRGVSRPLSEQRAAVLRTLLCSLCQTRTGSILAKPPWHYVDEITREVQVAEGQQEVISVCALPGTPQNGGGAFELAGDHSGLFLRFHRDFKDAMLPNFSSEIHNMTGDIHSPIGGTSSSFAGSQRSFQPYGSFPHEKGF